jgi:hypothetical protein
VGAEELPASPSPSGSSAAIYKTRMDVVRSKMEMPKCGGGDGKTRGPRFNMPTIVKDRYCKLSGQLELLMVEREGAKRHIPRGAG